ncbi:ubiquitin--protein ligase [Alginatibacterium sediminis]|uniref:Ubiquitin--protein ligase n=1 Tax=Alginatibacterium sediminis TaxID=2164068 RepID=A0A420E7Y5_9ALTE|nr:zinc ribbon domain-containing protein [Alginatibacterium sediminis]RKF15521.1 ubiquitin--protein ligase [Alginatibacterium sediminis]
MLCAVCHLELGADFKSGLCPHCDRSLQVVAQCDVCDQALEVMKACGAVNYFCNHCNTLKSKKKIVMVSQIRPDS